MSDVVDDKAHARSLAEIGRDAARKAQREALLATLEACGWRLTEAGAAIGLNGGAGNVLRSIRSLGLSAEYEAAKAAGKIRHGGVRKSKRTPLTSCSGRGTVGA